MILTRQGHHREINSFSTCDLNTTHKKGNTASYNCFSLQVILIGAESCFCFAWLRDHGSDLEEVLGTTNSSWFCLGRWVSYSLLLSLGFVA